MTVRIICATALLVATWALEMQAQQKFTIRPDKDPISDEDRSGAFVLSEGKRLFGVRCEGKQLRVVYIWGTHFMGSDGAVTVTHRLPPTPAEVNQWGLSTNNQGAFMPQSKAQDFIKAALQNKSLVLRVTDRDGDQHTDQFDISDLPNALKQLSCYTQQ